MSENAVPQALQNGVADGAARTVKNTDASAGPANNTGSKCAGPNDSGLGEEWPGNTDDPDTTEEDAFEQTQYTRKDLVTLAETYPSYGFARIVKDIHMPLFNVIKEHYNAFPGPPLNELLWKNVPKEERPPAALAVVGILDKLPRKGEPSAEDGYGGIYNFTSRTFWSPPRKHEWANIPQRLIEPVKIGITRRRNKTGELDFEARLKEQKNLWRKCEGHLTVPTEYCNLAELLIHRLLDIPEYLTVELRHLLCANINSKCSTCKTMKHYYSLTPENERDQRDRGHHEWFTLSTNTTCCQDLVEAVEKAVKKAVTSLPAQDSSPESNANASGTEQQVQQVLASLLQIRSLHLPKAVGDEGELSQAIASDLPQSSGIETIDRPWLVDRLLHHILRAYTTRVTHWVRRVVDAITPIGAVEETTPPGAVEEVLQPHMYKYLEKNLSQDRIDGRYFSHACTLISCLVVYRWLSTRQSTGRSVSESPWQDFVRDICDGNSAYHEADLVNQPFLGVDEALEILKKTSKLMSLGTLISLKSDDALANALQVCSEEAGKSQSILGGVLVSRSLSISLIFLPDREDVRLYDSHSHGDHRGALIAVLASDWKTSASVISFLVGSIQDGCLHLLQIDSNACQSSLSNAS